MTKSPAAEPASIGANGIRGLSRPARCALGVLGLIVLATVVGPWLSPHAVDAIDFRSGFCRRDIGWREIKRLAG